MATPSISVVVTCYNYARYVAKAIESVLAQDYPATELVIVNDGSKDESLTIIRRYAERAHVIDQPNQGHLVACYNGFLATHGEVVVFLDADDQLEPTALSAIGRAWSKGCTKVQYDLTIIDATGRDTGRRFCHFPKDYDAIRVREAFRRTGTYRWPVTVGNAYSRWFIQKLFPLEVEQAPDGYLNTVAPVYGDVITIARVLGSYRVHGHNRWSSSKGDYARLPERIAHRQHEVAFMREHARLNNVPVASVNVLDHEIAFISYRLMAVALGLDYQGRERDSVASLMRSACRLLLTEKYPPTLCVIHLVWLGLLAVLPRELAQQWIALRLNRSQLLTSAKTQLARLLGRSQGA